VNAGRKLREEGVAMRASGLRVLEREAIVKYSEIENGTEIVCGADVYMIKGFSTTNS
jgi:hypothetical protein